MRRLIIFSLVFLLLPLAGCGYSQEDLDDAYQTGYEAGWQDAEDAHESDYDIGYDEGYIQGQEDTKKELSSLQYVAVTDKVLGALTLLEKGFDITDYYHKPECEVYQWYLSAFTEYGFEGEKHEEWFHSPGEAETAGYLPCPVCFPEGS